MNLLDLYVKIAVDDNASGPMEQISTGMIAKSQLIADSIEAAMRRVASAFRSAISGAVGVYAEYEQLKGGIETFFKESSQTVIDNAKKAYETAGMSINQYMETVSGFATTLVRSVAEGNAQSAQESNESAIQAMQQQYSDLQDFLSQELSATQQAFSDEERDLSQAFSDELDQVRSAQQEIADAVQRAQRQELSQRTKYLNEIYERRSDELSDEVERITDAGKESVEQRRKYLTQELDALKDSLDAQVSAHQSATETRIRLIDEEYRESLKNIDREEYERLKSIDAQIAALEGQTAAEEKAAKAQQQAEERAELEKQLASARTAKGRERAQKELNDYLSKLAQEQAKEERKEQIQRLKDERSNVKQSASERKSDLKEQYDQEKTQYRESRSKQLDEQRKSNAAEIKARQEQNATIISQMQSANSKRIAQIRKANATELRVLKQMQSDETDAMRDGQSDRLKELRSAQSAGLKARQRANEDTLRDLQRFHQNEIAQIRKANQDQIAAARSAVAEQKKIFESGTADVGKFIEDSANDRAKAAELADMAIRDMSDNANKMGTDMSMVQNAYQGFAKNNFTMLDNLKLGFAGSKEGMEQLLVTAEQISAKNGEIRDFSIDSFADIVEAIHTVQQEYAISGYGEDELRQKIEERSLTEQELQRISQDLYSARKGQYDDEADAYRQVVEQYESGKLTVQDALILTGTTSYEASQTIQGSISTMQAAWENWVLSVTGGEGDVDETTDALIKSIGTVVENVAPVVKTTLETLFKYIQEHGPEVFGKLKSAIIESLPEEWREKLKDFGNKADEFLKSLEPVANWLQENLPKAFEFLGGVIESFTSGDAKPLMDTLNGLGQLFGLIGGTFYKVGNNIGVVLADFVSGLEGTANVGDTVFYDIGKGIRDVGEFFSSVGETIGNIVSDVVGFFDGLGKGAAQAYEDVKGWFEGIPSFISGLFDGSPTWLLDAGWNILNGLLDGLKDAWNSVTEFVGGIGDWIVQNKGPEQYDKKLLIPAGKWIMGGFNEGLRSQFGDIEDTIGDVTDLMHIDADMSAKSARGILGEGIRTGDNVMNVYVDKVYANDPDDVDALSERLNDKWTREALGALAW